MNHHITAPHSFQSTGQLITKDNLSVITARSIEFSSSGEFEARKIKFRLGNLKYTFVVEDKAASEIFKDKIQTVTELTGGNGNLLTNVVFSNILEFAKVESIIVDTLTVTIGNGDLGKFPKISDWKYDDNNIRLFNQPHSTGNPIFNGGGVTTKSDPNYMLCNTVGAV